MFFIFAKLLNVFLIQRNRIWIFFSYTKVFINFPQWRFAVCEFVYLQHPYIYTLWMVYSTTATKIRSCFSVFAATFIFEIFSGCLQVNATALKSWYTLLKLSLHISPTKHFSWQLIPQIAKFSSCWKFRHFLIGQEMTKLPVTASRTGKPFLFCVLLSPGRAPVTEALHDVYDYHQWALPLHQIENGSSVLASSVAGGKFSFIHLRFLKIWIETSKNFCQMLGVQLSNCLQLWCKVYGRQWNVKLSDALLSGFFCIQVWRNLVVFIFLCRSFVRVICFHILHGIIQCCIHGRI